jgi:predicted ATPase
VDWSHDLLEPDDQEVLRRIAVFPASFDLAAAEAVAGPAALDGLGRLVDRSLVTVQRDAGGYRYRLLETIRAYAAQKLAAAGELERTADALVGHFRSIATDWLVGDYKYYSLAYCRATSVDIDSFRLALDRSWAQGDTDTVLVVAGALYPYWMFAGDLNALEWMERAAAVPVTDRQFVRAAVLVRLGLIYTLRNAGLDRDGRSEDLAAEGMRITADIDDEWAQARARHNAAEIAMAT